MISRLLPSLPLFIFFVLWIIGIDFKISLYMGLIVGTIIIIGRLIYNKRNKIKR